MIRLFNRARCWALGHAWTRWSDWNLEGFGFWHARNCTRCPAVEEQRDGEEGIIHA